MHSEQMIGRPEQLYPGLNPLTAEILSRFTSSETHVFYLPDLLDGKAMIYGGSPDKRYGLREKGWDMTAAEIAEKLRTQNNKKLSDEVQIAMLDAIGDMPLEGEKNHTRDYSWWHAERTQAMKDVTKHWMGEHGHLVIGDAKLNSLIGLDEKASTPAPRKILSPAEIIQGVGDVVDAIGETAANGTLAALNMAMHSGEAFIDFLNYARRHPFKTLATLGFSGLLIACGAQAPVAIPTARPTEGASVPGGAPNPGSAENPAPTPAPKLTETALPATAVPPEQVAGDFNGFGVFKFVMGLNHPIYGTIDGNNFASVDADGHQFSVPEGGINFLYSGGIMQLKSDQGTWVESNGQWVKFDPEQAKNEIFMVKNVQGRDVEWNGSDFELSIPFTNADLEATWGAGNWKFDENGNLLVQTHAYGGQSPRWETLITLNEDGTLGIRVVDQEVPQQIKKEDLRNIAVNGVDIKTVEMTADGMFALPEFGAFTWPVDVQKARGGVANYQETDQDAYMSRLLEYSTLLKVKEINLFPPGTPQAQLFLNLSNTGDIDGIKVTMYPNTDAKNGDEIAAYNKAFQVVGVFRMKGPNGSDVIVAPIAINTSKGVLISLAGFGDGYLTPGEVAALETRLWDETLMKTFGFLVGTNVTVPQDIAQGDMRLAQPSVAALAGGEWKDDQWNQFPGLIPQSFRDADAAYWLALRTQQPHDPKSVEMPIDPASLTGMGNTITIPTFESPN